MARKIPDAICTINISPNNDPKPQKYDKLTGAGSTPNILLTKESIG